MDDPRLYQLWPSLINGCFILDASLAAAWCYKDETTEYTNGVLAAVSGFVEALAPHLWAYELRNTVLTGVRRKRITQADADEFLDSLADLRISLTHPISYNGIFSLANRYGLTVYDASYLDLALREGLPVASLDAELIRAAERSGVGVFQL